MMSCRNHLNIFHTFLFVLGIVVIKYKVTSANLAIPGKTSVPLSVARQLGKEDKYDTERGLVFCVFVCLFLFFCLLTRQTIQEISVFYSD